MSGKVLVPVAYIKDMENALNFGKPSDIRIARRRLWSCIESAPEPASAEPVATTLLPDPYDERGGSRFSLSDWEKLDELPAGTKLYAHPPAQQWIKCSERLPDVLDVRIKLSDGSEINCWTQADGDFYWKGGGHEIFICADSVTHWIPRPPAEG